MDNRKKHCQARIARERLPRVGDSAEIQFETVRSNHFGIKNAQPVYENKAMVPFLETAAVEIDHEQRAEDAKRFARSKQERDEIERDATIASIKARVAHDRRAKDAKTK